MEETDKRKEQIERVSVEYKGDKLIDLLTSSKLIDSDKLESYVVDNSDEFPALKLTRNIKIKAKLFKTIINNILCRPIAEVNAILESPTCPTIHQLLVDIVRRAAVNKECRDFVTYAAMNQDSDSITMEMEHNKKYVGAIEGSSGGEDPAEVGPTSQRRIFHLVPKQDQSPESVEQRQRDLKRNSLDQVNELLEKNNLQKIDLSDIAKKEKEAVAATQTPE